MRAAADQAQIDFAKRAAEAGEAARGATAPEGSDARAAAQTALSALIVARGRLEDVAGALDALRRDHAGAAPADLSALDAAAARVDALAVEEDGTLSRITALLPS